MLFLWKLLFHVGPVAILYQDREIQAPNSVINYLQIIPDAMQAVLLLECVSTYPHNNLRWRIDNSLYANESIELSSSGTVNVTYSDIGTQQRLVTLSIPSFTNDNIGKYYCTSEQTNYSSASVFVTTKDPLFELISPEAEYYPLGAQVSTLTVQYGDMSVGYMQQGHGFNFSLTFLPCVEGLPNNVLIPHRITLRNQSRIIFHFQAGSMDSGEYLWNGNFLLM